MHCEDIKSELRKRYGSLASFSERVDLPRGLVSDTLRGRRSSRAEAAIAAALNLPIHKVFPKHYGFNDSSLKADNSPLQRRSHRLTAEAR
ncbi:MULTISPECIES: helix-turn-helix domain-containing protein [Brevundimonas]|jgi:lambda repressor-like predicted transcriptional regulator|uniref:Sugar fermentation stimulation protein B n=1 Tax=Brevundimonas vesicularis TaxID=41276 RepID=A0A1Z3U897_BREVE|nr:sugar fermentation stimulation protein B [Brevundimonas vesicularis]MRL67842.1 transcriptional regulator [Brevundimonas sp. SPF441]